MSSGPYDAKGDFELSKHPETIVKQNVREASQKIERGIDDAAGGIRQKGADLRDYLKKLNADVEVWKFGVEESKEGYRVEWRMVALVKHPKKSN